jgi:hypothetical protein
VRCSPPRSPSHRELYLPRGWIANPERLQATGVPDQVGFATKPALATKMLARTLDAGVPAAWVAGDEVYGADPALRAELEARGIGYVLAVACDHPVLAAGERHRADALLRRVPARAWQCVSVGRGAKGHRYYDWAFLRLDPGDPSPGGQRWLMVRRNRSTGELAFYRCFMPRLVSLATLVRVAGRRWTIEERFQTGKGLVGGPASAAPLALLVPVDHPGDARPRLPGRGRLDRPDPPATIRADQPDLQRGPAPVRGAGHPSHRRSRPPAALVGLATPTSSLRPHLPLPTTSRATMKVTIYGWRISRDESKWDKGSARQPS